MGRPKDWSPIAGGDPVPGEVADIKDLAVRYGDTAEAIRTAADRLRKLHAAGKSEALDAFREVTGETAKKIEKAEERYQGTSEALEGWAGDLDNVQADADAGLARAQAAEIDRDRYDRQAEAAEDEKEKKRLEKLRDAEQAKIDAERGRVEGWHETWDSAGKKRAGQIEDIIEHDDVKDSRWDNIAGVLSAIADIAGTIAAIAGVAALLVGWIPVIGQALAGILGTIALIATAISLVCNLALLIGGKGSWGSVALDVFSLATFGIGRAFTSAAKASTLASRSMTRVAAARGLRSSQGLSNRAASRMVTNLLGPANGASARAYRAVPVGQRMGASQLLRLGYGGLGSGLRADAAALRAGLSGGAAPFRAGFSGYASGGSHALAARGLGAHDLAGELAALQSSRHALAGIDGVKASNLIRVNALAQQGTGQLATAGGGIVAGFTNDSNTLLGGGGSGSGDYDVTPPSVDHDPVRR